MLNESPTPESVTVTVCDTGMCAGVTWSRYTQHSQGRDPECDSDPTTAITTQDLTLLWGCEKHSIKLLAELTRNNI